MKTEQQLLEDELQRLARELGLKDKISYTTSNGEVGHFKIENECLDRFGSKIKDKDIVSVQLAGNFDVYKKEDGYLYFKPYGDEEKVNNYFSNDLEIIQHEW